MDFEGMKQNGSGGDRTPGLLIANQALSQLSYRPMKVAIILSKQKHIGKVL